MCLTRSLSPATCCGQAQDAGSLPLALPALQVYMGLASEGYELSYRRIPLSRDRTPEAADLDTLHSQLLQQPPGVLGRGSDYGADPTPNPDANLTAPFA